MINYNDKPNSISYPTPRKATEEVLSELFGNGTGFVRLTNKQTVRAFVFKGQGPARLYTSTSREISDHFPHLVRAFSKLANGTIAVVELNHDNIRSLVRSKADSAISRQQETSVVIAEVVDLLHLKGADLTEQPFFNRMQLVQRWVKRHFRGHRTVVRAPFNLSSRYTRGELAERLQANEYYHVWNLHDPYSFYKWSRSPATATRT